jgi:Glycine-zipper domain
MVMKLQPVWSALAASLLLGACATVPGGPSVQALPGSTKSAAQFQADAVACQQHAEAALGGVTAGQAYNETVAANAIAGTALGAATGALIGAATGQAGAGAAIGAGTGLLFGTAAGTNVAGFSYADVQRRYDSVYLRCMYAKGNRVPTRTVQRLAPIYPPPNTAAPAWPPANAQAPAYPPPNTPAPWSPPSNTPPPRYPPAGTPAPSYPPPDTPAPLGLPPPRG